MVNTENLQEVNYIESRTSLDELNAKSTMFDSSLSYSYGVLTMFSKAFACIKPAFYNYEYSLGIEYKHSEIVIFDPTKASMGDTDEKINAQKNLYLVRYADGGVTTNQKTGETQPTIDYSVPLEILLKCTKKQCVCLEVLENSAILRMLPPAESNNLSKSISVANREIDESTVAILESKINADIKRQGFAYASALPAYLGEACGTRDVRQYADGVGSFVKKYLDHSFRYESSYLYNGKTIPGVILLNNSNKDHTSIASLESHSVDVSSLLSELEVLTSDTGYYLASEMPRLIEKHCLINYKTVAQSIAEFTDKYLSSKFTLVKEIAVNGKRIPNVIIPNDRVGEFTTEIIAVELTQELIESLEDRIQRIIDINGVFLCSLFPSFIRDFGIEDYHDYASSVELFVDKYLSSKFTVKRNIKIGDKYYPNVIINKNDANDDNHQDGISNHANASTILNDLHEANAWEEYLTSPLFNQADTSSLPLKYIKMGIRCASVLLKGEYVEEINLTLFEKELLTNKTSKDFLRKWKTGPIFNNKILQSYTQSSMCSLSFPDDKYRIIKIINQLGQETKPNTSFKSLMPRFETTKDKLVPYLYVIRLYASNSLNAIVQLVSEYCYFIKSLYKFNVQTFQRRVLFEEQVNYFKSFLNLAYGRMSSQPIPRSLRTNIISVFFDIKQSSSIKDFLHSIDKNEEYPEWKIVRFMQSEVWCEEQLKELFTDLNLQLVEKSVALVWDQYSKKKELPESFLSVLSWIIKYGNNKALDEIITIHNLSNYTKKQKQIVLLNSLHSLLEKTAEIESNYNLICYIINYVFSDFSANDYPQINDYYIKWNTLSNEYFKKCIDECMPLTMESEGRFIKLLSIFSYDQEKEIELQTLYGKWYSEQKDRIEKTTEQSYEILHSLYAKACYYAFQIVYEQSPEEVRTIEKLRELYVDSLIKLNSYNKAIRFAYECEDILHEAREKYIVRAVVANFTKHGLSQSGLAVFNNDFTIQEAIDVLMRHFIATDYPLILSLIILYAYNDELIKSTYLYSIFHTRAEVGFVRTYSQFRTIYLRRISGNITNHYEVMQLAFNSLSMVKLLNFIKWAGTITIPNYTDYSPSHVFSVFYDSLLKNSEDANTWEKSYNYFIINKEKNAWLICVCGTIMMHKFGIPYDSLTRDSFVVILGDISVEKPKNLLDFLCQYIIDNDDVALCSQVGQLLNDNNVKSHLLENNPLCRSNGEVIDSFTNFCLEKLQETGNTLFYDIITNLKDKITEKDLIILSRYSKNKTFIIKKLCECYMEDTGKEAAKELLNPNLWEKASYQEKEIFKVLEMVYDSDTLLLDRFPKLFNNEEVIQRFKQDCTRIISAYPDSCAFLRFNQECLNLKHKLLVFSFTLGIFYNEDIYHSYWFEYDTLIEQGIFDVYLKYLEKCYEAQLVWNPSYIFEYKTWRYLKLLMLENIQSDKTDDAQILKLMKANGHYERLLSEGYNEFKQNIEELLLTKDIEENEKQQLLFGLISADFSSFWDLENSFLFKLSPRSIDLLKSTLFALNYRDVNERFFHKYIPLIDKVNNNDIVALAKTFSDSLALAFNEWHTSDIKNQEPGLFSSLTIEANAIGKSGGNICVEKVLELEESLYNANKSFINAIVFSRQLPGKVFDRLRMSAIGRAKGCFNERFEELAIYLKSNGYSMALSQYKYLIALKYATEKKQKELRDYLDKNGTEFLENVPADWRTDSAKILKYVQSDNTEALFKPNVSFYYSESYLVEAKDISFVNLIYENYKRYHDKTDSGFSKIKTEYIVNEKIDIHERISTALCYFHSVGINGENFGAAIEFGFLLISKESTSISANHKLDILVDLHDQRNYLSQLQKERIFECFTEIYREFSIDIWIDNQKEIFRIISLNAAENDVIEVQKLIKNIQDNCPEFAEPSASRATELLYVQLREIAFIGSSAYVGAIKSAASRRIKQIESGNRLTICIENENGLLQDGCVYFQIKNTGSLTVDLQDNCDIILTAVLPNNQLSKYSVVVTNIRKLRTGWITGCVQDIKNLCKSCNPGECITVKIDVKINEKIITRTTALLKIAKPVLLKARPRPGYHVRYAAGENDKNRLYGREEEQEDIAYAIDSGKVVIYGPSRIGKTSLLNWIRHNLAAERGNVITVLFGGEGGKGKESDYTEYFYDSNHKKILYDDANRTEVNASLSEYLLIDTLKYGLTDKRFGRANFDADIMKNQDLLNQISSILDQKEPIEYRYRQIDSVLKANNSELWILFDEFQQVVERWSNLNDNEPTEFIRLCEGVNEIDISNIKLVFCGSDELLRQMVLVRQNSVWRKKILNTAGQVRIGPIKETSSSVLDDPFRKMISEDDSVIKPGIIYSKEALTAICVYSARVPMYGKEICNTILENIAQIGSEKFGRNVIYSYDVAKATQMLATQMLDDIRKNDTITDGRNEYNTSRIVQIFDAVTKGLDDDTDKQYLWYIAKWFINNPAKDRFPYSEFDESSSKRLVYGEDALRDSLTIARERGIISGDERNGYVFSTVFYHNAFCGTVNNLKENKIFICSDKEEAEDDEINTPFVSDLETVKQIFGNMDEESQEWAIGGMALSAKSPNIRKKLKEIAGKSYEGDDRSITVNAQNITNTINGIFAAGTDFSQIVSNLQSLPRLNTYLGDSGIPLLEELESENSVVVAEAEAKLESTTSQMVSDYLSALVSNNDAPDEFCVWEMLRISELTYRDISKKIVPSFMAELILAAKLDYIFDLAKSDGAELDRSPVCIMYCKILEKVLRFYHTKKYQVYFPDNSCEKDCLFGDLITMEEKDRMAIQNKILLGSFLYPINLKYNTETDWVHIPKSQRSDWKQHSKMLNQAVSIRNKSAHGNSNGNIVGTKQLETLKRLLFSDDGILNIIGLSEED